MANDVMIQKFDRKGQEFVSSLVRLKKRVNTAKVQPKKNMKHLQIKNGFRSSMSMRINMTWALYYITL